MTFLLAKEVVLFKLSYNYSVFSKIYDNLLSKLVKISSWD